MRLVVDDEDALLHDVVTVTMSLTGKERRTRVPPCSRATLSSVTPVRLRKPARDHQTETEAGLPDGRTRPRR